MGTAHTGIPMLVRNIDPPPTPLVKLTIRKIVVDGLGAVIDDNATFYLNILQPNGVTLSMIPFSQNSPVVLNMPYGTYVISEYITGFVEDELGGYVLDEDENSSAIIMEEANLLYTIASVVPSTFELSAYNPQQTITITNTLL